MLDKRTRERLSEAMESWVAASRNAIDLQRELISIDISRAAIEDRLAEQERLRDNAAALVNETLADVEETDESISEVERILAPFLGEISSRMAVLP